MSMHRFKKEPMPEGESLVIETCMYCPQRRVRYSRLDKYGKAYTTYLDSSGSQRLNKKTSNRPCIRFPELVKMAEVDKREIVSFSVKYGSGNNAEIIHLLSNGLSIKEISEKIPIEEITLIELVTKMCIYYGAKNILHLCIMMIDLGLYKRDFKVIQMRPPSVYDNKQFSNG